MGFHPEGMALADCKKFAKLGQLNRVELLLSKSSLRDSIKTVYQQKNGKPSHTLDGRFIYLRDEPGVDDRFRGDFVIYKKQKPHCVKASTMHFNDAAANAADFSGLRRMIKIAKEHHIELVLFAYPRHAYFLEVDNQCGGQDAFWRAMKQIASIIETEAEPDQVRAWQFYSYNEITAEPIGMTTRYWQDAGHFNFEMGNMMLADMFGENTNGPKFGRQITTQSIETDFQDFLQGRSKYLLQHPEFYTNLQKLQ
jgi:hypothetical protein